MKARLNKAQIQRLLDGKPLVSGRMQYALPTGESDLKSFLENFLRDNKQATHDVLLDTEKSLIMVEERK